MKVITVEKCYPSCPYLGEAVLDRMGNFVGHKCTEANQPIPKEYASALNDEFPDWCPLHELPDKQETYDGIDYDDGFAEGWNGFSYDEGFTKGWNDCLKEIMGDDK